MVLVEMDEHAAAEMQDAPEQSENRDQDRKINPGEGPAPFAGGRDDSRRFHWIRSPGSYPLAGAVPVLRWENYWALGIGHWALGIGHWALGIGHWFTRLNARSAFGCGLWPRPHRCAKCGGQGLGLAVVMDPATNPDRHGRVVVAPPPSRYSKNLRALRGLQEYVSGSRTPLLSSPSP